MALLLELYGDEGLTKPAMHYRWNLPEENGPRVGHIAAEFESLANVPLGRSYGNPALITYPSQRPRKQLAARSRSSPPTPQAEAESAAQHQTLLASLEQRAPDTFAMALPDLPSAASDLEALVVLAEVFEGTQSTLHQE